MADDNRITEAQLTLPSLYIMAARADGRITTSELIKELGKIMRPSGVDAQTLPNRRDSYFSQKVRNLKSHDTFSRKGYAVNIKNGFEITPEGRSLVDDHREELDYILSGRFGYDDVRESTGRMAQQPSARREIYEEYVEEGAAKMTDTRVYRRSRRLRDRAVEHFTKDGVITCACCGFDFNRFYGPELGRSYIEIHHIHPIYKNRGVSKEMSLAEAMLNLMPLCSNCHRVIHLNNIGADGIEELKKAIKRH